MGSNTSEGSSARPKRRWLKLGVGVSVVSMAGLAAGVAFATIPDSGGVIHGCMANSSGVFGPAKGTVRIIDSATDKCQANETAVQWSQTGPTGQAGAQGAAGPQGASGPQGPKGDPGAQAPVACPPLAAPASPGATIGMFGKIAGAPGESIVEGHINEISVTSFTGGLVNDSCGKGGGKPAFAPVTFGHKFDTASPPLALDAASAAIVPDATFTILSNGTSHDYVTIALSNVLVTGVQTVANADALHELVTLNYTRIKMAYQTFKTDGTPGTPATFCWDQVAAAAC